MTESEKRARVEDYLRAYNAIDIESMLEQLHEEISFTNVANGEVTLQLDGLGAFRNQAEQMAGLFVTRQQRITSTAIDEDVFVVAIDYEATLAASISPSLKAGDKIKLQGKSLFRFRDRKIIEIRDIS